MIGKLEEPLERARRRRIGGIGEAVDVEPALKIGQPRDKAAPVDIGIVRRARPGLFQMIKIRRTQPVRPQHRIDKQQARIQVQCRLLAAHDMGHPVTTVAGLDHQPDGQRSDRRHHDQRIEKRSAPVAPHGSATRTRSAP